MSLYEDRQNAVKRWADKRWPGKSHTVKHGEFTQASYAWTNRIKYPFADHANYILGKGLVVQPYINPTSIAATPPEAEEIQLDENWVEERTRSYFIPKIFLK